MNALLRQRTGIALLLFSLGASACGLKDAWQDHERVTRALKSELGIDAKVGIDITNGHTSVSVQLPGAPLGDAGDAKRAITAVVVHACRSKIERVDISY